MAKLTIEINIKGQGVLRREDTDAVAKAVVADVTGVVDGSRTINLRDVELKVVRHSVDELA